MTTAAITAGAGRRSAWNTLQLLRAARTALLALDVLLLLAVVSAAGAHHGALKTVGRDTAPSIIAAQHIKTALAGMDAEVSNELLTEEPTQLTEVVIWILVL